jgi:hypothetical protein
MLNHHTGRLTRRLMILLFLVAALLWAPPRPVEQKTLAATPNPQTAPASVPKIGSYRGCIQTFNPEGQCIWVCCYGGYCYESSCD